MNISVNLSNPFVLIFLCGTVARGSFAEEGHVYDERNLLPQKK